MFQMNTYYRLSTNLQNNQRHCRPLLSVLPSPWVSLIHTWGRALNTCVLHIASLVLGQMCIATSQVSLFRSETHSLGVSLKLSLWKPIHKSCRLRALDVWHLLDLADSLHQAGGAQFLSHHNNATHSGQLYKQAPCVLHSLYGTQWAFQISHFTLLSTISSNVAAERAKLAAS